MNTNRQNNNNNRRRGRGNNNNRQQNNNRSGFDYQNRVDNRARGNASQMLEKYKKLASDAQLNGDRVNAEYYLQFADHYFRVLADTKSRQEARQEENQPRRERSEWQDESEELDGTETVADNGNDEAEGENDEDEQRQDRNSRPRRERSDRNRQPRRHHSEDAAEEADGNVEGGLDLTVLPPSIGMKADEEPEVELRERPARKPRTRRPAATANDEDVVDAAE